ncbi:MAG: fibronectin type III domain-containing protein, partial [Nitrospinae bacterium]|nr:fibronectin type III domain-containing protein [Nitrospinota bacterium]
MNSYIGKALLFVLSISLTLGFLACDNKETTTNDDRRLVAGKVIKGPVQNAAIKVYTLNSNRFRDAIIGEGGTASDGSFSLQVDNNKGGPLVLIVANGGDYTDEATGQRIAIPSWWELSVLVPWPNDYSKVILTPLTQMASEQAFSRIIRGENPLSAQENGRRSVADYFGLRNVDITRVEPADLTSRNTAMRRGNPETEYGLVLAALSQMTKGEGLPPLLTLSLIQNIVDDISDGRVDDVGRNGSVLPNNLTATPSYLIASLQGASNDFLRGPRNASGIPGADSPTYTQAQGGSVPNRPTQGGSGGGSSGGSSGGGQICDPCDSGQGACSDHGGVNCSAGQDSDGSVICNDGWLDSTVQYSCSNSSLPAPTGVTATPGDHSMTVSWNEVAGAASYIVYVDAGLGSAQYASAAPPETITGLQTCGFSYTFWVTAVDS